MRTRRAVHTDAGFTLVEVVVAMVLLAIVATAAFTLFVRTLQTSKALDTRSTAITVAQQAIDQARSVTPAFDASFHSGLVDGRQQALVTAQFASPPAGVDVSQTYPDYDAAATSTSTPVIPLTSTTTVGAQTYNVATVIGQCVLTKSTGVCNKTVTGTTPPAVSSLAAGTTLVERVIVSVTWTSPTTCPTVAACSYAVATLIDPASNPQFDVYLLRANDDIITAPCTTTTSANNACTASLGVLANDLGKFGTNAVTVVTAPPNGSINTTSVNGNPAITYTPNNCTATTNAFSGLDTFTYNATDIHGDATNAATVSVTVLAPATPTAGSSAPTWSVNTTSGATIATLNNAIPNGSVGAWCSASSAVSDLILTSTNPAGSLVTLAAAGTGTGSMIRATLPAGWSGNANFTYRLKDAFGQKSAPLNGLLTVLPVASAGTGTAGQGKLQNGSVAGLAVGSSLTYSLASGASNGTATVSATGAITYTSNSSWPGGTSAKTDTFTYRVTDAAGQSTTNTVTMTVYPPPRATAFKYGLCPATNTTTTFDFGSATYLPYATFYAPAGPTPVAVVAGNVTNATVSAAGLVVTYKTFATAATAGKTLFSFQLYDIYTNTSSLVAVTC